MNEKQMMSLDVFDGKASLLEVISLPLMALMLILILKASKMRRLTDLFALLDLFKNGDKRSLDRQQKYGRSGSCRLLSPSIVPSSKRVQYSLAKSVRRMQSSSV
jgi:hypothetical protein